MIRSQTLALSLSKFIRNLRIIQNMDEFRSFGICPDVIDNPPFQLLQINWSDSNVNANKGNILTPKQLRNPPSNLIWMHQKDSYYTLLMVDPDAPTRKHPENREWLHWMIVNIPNDKIDEGEVKAEYIGPGPPKNSGLHRYVWLVFRQPSKIDFSEVPYLSNKTCKGRAKFNTRSFAQNHLLNQLVASNFIQAEWDDYVDEMYKQMEP